MKRQTIVIRAFVAAALFALGLPNEFFHYGFPALGYVALVPLYGALGAAPSYGMAALAAGLYGALHHALSSYWLYFFKDFALWTIGATTLAYFIVYAVLGLYLAFFLKKAESVRPFAFALLWASFEYLKSSGFLGYPWGLIPYTQTRVLALLQIADTTGVYGLSFFLALVNATLAELLADHTRRGLCAISLLECRPDRGEGQGSGGTHRPRLSARHRLRAALLPPKAFAPGLQKAYILFTAVLALLIVGYGAYRLAIPPRPEAELDALLVQQNVDPWIEGEEAALEANILLARSALTDTHKPPELIVFSESSLKRPFAEFRRWFSAKPEKAPLIPFIKETGAYLLTGAPVVLDWESLAMTNSVILIDPEAHLVADYAKTHPVPFAEAIPFWEYEAFRRFMQEKVGLDAGWTMGSEHTVFELPTQNGTLRFGSPICFEDAFPDVCAVFVRRGADLLINLTNDSWSRTVSAEIQHFAAARFRAIEFRRSLVRSTNGGLTCVVDARGAVIDELPLFTGAALRTTVPIYRGTTTVYLRFGDWFALLCLLLSGLGALILIAKDLRERRREP